MANMSQAYSQEKYVGELLVTQMGLNNVKYMFHQKLCQNQGIPMYPLYPLWPGMESASSKATAGAAATVSPGLPMKSTIFLERRVKTTGHFGCNMLLKNHQKVVNSR